MLPACNFSAIVNDAYISGGCLSLDRRVGKTMNPDAIHQCDEVAIGIRYAVHFDAKLISR